MMPDGTRLATGAILAINPVYMTLLDNVLQVGLSIGGGVIIVLTIRKLLLEIKIRKRDLAQD